jgi:hypothetical protein
MVDHTFQSRIAGLAQKCRRAVRLYTSSIGRAKFSDEASSSERQIQVWRDTNQELLNRLVAILERGDRKSAVIDVYEIRDEYYGGWRYAEAELHKKQSALITAAENADFNKCSVLSDELVVLKAQLQAKQAVHHELQALLDKTRPARPQDDQNQDEQVSASWIDAVEQSGEEEPDQSPLLQQAKVIPLRRFNRN